MSITSTDLGKTITTPYTIEKAQTYVPPQLQHIQATRNMVNLSLPPFPTIIASPVCCVLTHALPVRLLYSFTPFLSLSSSLLLPSMGYVR